MRPLAALFALLPLARPAASQATVAPTRLGPEEAIEIDGRLDEAAWTRAARLGPLTQVDPVEGARPSQPTVVRLAYDSDFLYLALECREDPDKVFARQMDRDAFVRFDDVVELWIDTFHDQRFAFWFQITAAGSRGDALLSDSGQRFNKDWDGIWYGRTRITERGWQAEIALPFKTLAFRPGGSTWGFNLRRKRKFNDEESRWARPRVAYRFFDLSQGGTLTGLEDLHQGLGLDVVPYAKASGVRNPAAGRDELGLLFDLGLDVKYRLTPALNLRLTANTDFAETEVDSRQVNLTRFPLFFPEKRDFFLEDAGVFEFGSPDRRRQLVPFFSRTIGRDSAGAAVPILFGAKLTGRAGPWNVGGLGTWLDSHDAVGEKLVGALRLSRNLGGQNAVGVLATAGRPNDTGDAATYGFDFRLGGSDLLGQARGLSVWGYWLGTQTSGPDDPDGDGLSYGIEAAVRTRNWEHELAHHVVGSDFDPQLGFVRRRDAREYRAQSEYTWRNTSGGFVRRANVRVSGTLVTSIAGAVQSAALPVRWLRLVLDSEDSIEFTTRFQREVTQASFDLPQGVPVPPGSYDMVRHELSVESNDRRKLGGEAELEYGSFFDGTLLRWNVTPVVIPSRHFQADLAYSEFHIDVPAGAAVTRLVELGADATFTPDVSWKNLVQWDNDSGSLGFQTRFRWILEPGNDLFLVGQFDWEDVHADGGLVPAQQDLVLKLVYTLRF